MRISCCSRAMSSQTQISLGSPHVSQITYGLHMGGRGTRGCLASAGTSLLGLLLGLLRGLDGDRATLDAVDILVLDGQDARDLAAQGADLARVRGRATHGLDAALLHELAPQFRQAGLAVFLRH